MPPSRLRAMRADHTRPVENDRENRLDGGRRSTGGARRKDGAGKRPSGTDSAACVSQHNVLRRTERVRVRPQRAGRAGAAVLGCLQVAQNVVVLDLLGHQHDRKKRDRHPGEPSNATGHAASFHCQIPMIRPAALVPQTNVRGPGLPVCLGLSWSAHANSL